jgi:Peptidase S46
MCTPCRRPIYAKSGAIVACAVALALAGTARGDEGLWLFNRPPLRQLRDRYGFAPNADWLEHLQKACVRFNDGGSGSFISADGLIMANQHVGADVLPKLSNRDHNYYRDGFYAKTRNDEKRCDGLEIDVLEQIEDVTQRVIGASDRAAAIAQIESVSAKRSGLRGEVISLFHGSEYHLYQYRHYADVRVVFAPEQQIAFFGGDPDNFEYPRFDFDVYFFRVYEQGHPARVQHFLTWGINGATENELVMVAGHPRHTERLSTEAALTYQRDIGLPEMLQQMHRLEVHLAEWSGRSDENARKAEELLFQIRDGRKAREGTLDGLLDPALIDHKRLEEQKLFAAIQGTAAYKDAWTAQRAISEAQTTRASLCRRYAALEERGGFNTILFDFARILVRAAEERTRPDGNRLTEYTESRLSSLLPALFTPQPIDRDYETFKLSESLTWLAGEFPDDPQFVHRVLENKSPRDRAQELVRGSRLDDLAFRKELYETGQASLSATRDPMIQLARLVDPASREVRKRMETEVDEVERRAYAALDRARHTLNSDDVYPEATSTLRLAYGTVRGYENQGIRIPFQTTVAGLDERNREHHNRPPFNLPQRWLERRDKLSAKTPFNFICTADVVSGNSGSPVVNRKGEVVGLVFDRNLPCLVLDYSYTDKQARAMGVDSRGIIEVFRKVYEAESLTQEILAPSASQVNVAAPLAKPSGNAHRSIR